MKGQSRANAYLDSVFQPSHDTNQKKTKTVTEYESEGGFCHTDIKLCSDSFYSIFQACEDHGYFDFGIYQMENDSIVFISTLKDIAENVVIRDSNVVSDRVELTITDRTGAPVNELLVLPYDSKTHYTFSNEYIQAWDDDTIHRLQPIYSDSTGKIQFKRTEYDSIELRELSMISGRRILLSAKKLPAKAEIVLNTPRFNFNYISDLTCKPHPRKIKFKLLKDKLTNRYSTLRAIKN